MSNFNVVRAENGQVRFTINGVKDYKIDGVGTVTGSATFSVGNDGKQANETVLEIGQTKDYENVLIDIDDDLDNIEFYGENIEARFKEKTDKQYNVQWSAVNSSMDTTKSNGAFLVNTDERSQNNVFKLGHNISNNNYQYYDNIVRDSGKDNTFIAAEKSANLFETTETSENAVIFGGNKGNGFLVGGKNGFVVGGNDVDEFITNGSAEQNVLIGMDGNDRFTDYGSESLIAGGQGVETLNANGQNGLAHLGDNEDYNVTFGASGKENAVFTAQEYERHNTASANDITVINYQDFLNDYLERNNMTMEEFAAKAQLNEDASVEDIINALKGEV